MNNTKGAAMIVKTYTIQVQHYRREETRHEGNEHSGPWISVANVPDKVTPHAIQIEIDIDAIAGQLGPRAVQNKSKKAKYLSGLIKVTEVRP